MGADCWGLECQRQRPRGYGAHAPDNDRGVITPAAALSSFAYAPREAMAALRHFYEGLGDRIWGRFGFVDAFSEQHDWYADSFVAISQGPLVAMIENYRSGLLWKLFMRIPEIQAGLKKLGFRSPHLDVSAGMMGLEAWIAAEARIATDAMLGAISATHLVMERPGFGQRVIPRPGSVLASPVPAHYDPEPDYFFHWFRDSAIVIDALRVALARRLRRDARPSAASGSSCSSAARCTPSTGASFSGAATSGLTVQPAFLQYLRPDAEIAALSGEAVLADVRVNADGTPDFIRWSRPQADGPALRCLALLRWWQQFPDLRRDARARR